MTDTEKTQITKLLEEIAKANRLPHVIFRGLVTGLFTAIGATIAFTVVIFLFTQLYSGIRGLPIIKDFMQATGLNTVVDYALEQVNKPTNTEKVNNQEEDIKEEEDKLEEQELQEENIKEVEDINNINKDTVEEVPKE